MCAVLDLTAGGRPPACGKAPTGTDTGVATREFLGGVTRVAEGLGCWLVGAAKELVICWFYMPTH